MYCRTYRLRLGPDLVQTDPYRHKRPYLGESVRLLVLTRTAYCYEPGSATTNVWLVDLIR
jgi:hypothetical protein